MRDIRSCSSGGCLLLLLVLLSLASLAACGQPVPGHLANAGFVNRRIKAAYFFSGQALDGSNSYDAQPAPGCNAPNCPVPVYSLHPVDQRHLQWFESVANQQFALNTMVQAGVNVVHMSSWGDDTMMGDPTKSAAAWVQGAAPLQTSPQSHDELFDAAAGMALLIVPFLEERDAGSLPWSFKDEFPYRADNALAPGAISQIEYLVRHYLQNPAHPEWAARWAQVYDKSGQPRFAVGIIHAASNRLAAGDDAAFAAGFDALAQQVWNDTHVSVGFLLDVLPAGGAAQASFFASPGGTGPYLADTTSVLGIACFVPEVYFAPSSDTALLDWKRQWSQGWTCSGVPFLMDVSSGYDGREVFGEDWYFGENSTWLTGLDQMAHEFGQSGVIFNSWNGYTEGMVAVPTAELGSLFYDWFSSLLVADVFALQPAAPTPRNGTWCSPYTLAEALQNVPVGGTIGLLATTTSPFTAPLTISSACTLTAVNGPATIGN